MLDGCRSGDGDGIDVWVGSAPHRRVVGLFNTIALLKRDREVTLCSEAIRVFRGFRLNVTHYPELLSLGRLAIKMV